MLLIKITTCFLSGGPSFLCPYHKGDLHFIGDCIYVAKKKAFFFETRLCNTCPGTYVDQPG